MGPHHFIQNSKWRLQKGFNFDIFPLNQTTMTHNCDPCSFVYYVELRLFFFRHFSHSFDLYLCFVLVLYIFILSLGVCYKTYKLFNLNFCEFCIKEKTKFTPPSTPVVVLNDGYQKKRFQNKFLEQNKMKSSKGPGLLRVNQFIPRIP